LATGNVYFITNYHEFYGPCYRFAYLVSTLSLQYSDLNVPVTSLDDSLFFPDIEKQKIQPLKQLKTIFKNEDMGGDVTNNDWMALATYTHDFTGGNGTPAEINASGNMVFHSEHGAGKHEDSISLASDFVVTEYALSYLRVEIDFRIQSPVFPDGIPNMRLEVSIKRPISSEWSAPVISMQIYGESWLGLDTISSDLLQIYGTGAYNLKLTFKPELWDACDWSTLDIEIRSLKITKVMGGALKDSEPEKISIDQDFTQINTTGIEKCETEIIISDGNQITEKGALMSSGNVLTKEWTRTNGGMEVVLLADAYTRNFLNNRSLYKNFLRMTIIDRDHLIDPNTMLTLKSKYYVFSSYSKNYRLGEIEAELVEIIPDSPNPM
jgi:hypothetical protein